MSLSRFIQQPWPADKVGALVDKLVKAIVQIYQPSRIFLFGSAAEGRFRDSSDLDIAIICSTEAEVRRARKLLLGRPPLIDWPVDYLFFDEITFSRKSETGGVCELILREGKQVFPYSANTSAQSG